MKARNIFLTLMLCCLTALSSGATDILQLRDSSTVVRDLCDSPALMLDGRMAGLFVNGANGDATSGASVMLRGMNSSMTASQPLWIVDGMPLANLQGSYLSVENQLAFLNAYGIAEIQVLKDLSATAIYGQRGANGVILVRTNRKLGNDGLTAEWNSAAGAVFPNLKNDAAHVGVGHNHSLLLSYVKGNSLLNISGEFVGLNGVLRRNSGNTGNFSVFYETMVNPVLWFGTNTICSVGGTSSPAAIEGYGAASLPMAARFGDYSRYGNLQDWTDNFDNDAVTYRVVNSSYLTVNFLKELNLKAEFGVDYHNLTRYLWYGAGTPLGDMLNASATIAGNSTLRFYVNPSLNWKRHFGDHYVKLSAGAKMVIDNSKANLMEGHDFLSQELRAKGLNIHSSKTVINNYSINYASYSAYLDGAWNYLDRMGFHFTVMPEWTPRYRDSKPVVNYGVDAWVKVWDGIKVNGGYGTAGEEFSLPYNTFGNYLASFTAVDPTVSFFYEGLLHKQSKEWHAGAEFAFLEGRITSSVKYFRKHSDEAFNIYCFGEQGSTYLWNWGGRKDVETQMTSFTTQGVELDIDTVPVKIGNWKWTLGASFTWCSNLVTYSDHPFGRDLGGMVACANVVGRPLGSFVGYQVLPDGSIWDKTGDGKVTAADKTLSGSPAPEYYGAFRTTLSYGDFRFEAIGDWAAGGRIADLGGLFNANPGADALLSTYVRRSDFVRIASLSASYDFKFPELKFLKGLGVKVSGLNLFSVSRYGQWNIMPDCYGIYGVQGMDYGSCLSGRKLVVGIRFLFQ